LAQNNHNYLLSMPLSQPKAIPSSQLTAVMKRLGDGTALVRIGSQFCVIQIDPSLVRHTPHWHVGPSPELALGSAIEQYEGKAISTVIEEQEVSFGKVQFGQRKVGGKPVPCVYAETVLSSPPPFWQGSAMAILLSSLSARSLRGRSFLATGALFGDHDKAIFVPWDLRHLKSKRPLYHTNITHFDDMRVRTLLSKSA
jgi:hypothetical protein